ncbi:MAG: ChbG/HpnK family deacetylase [Deltaproteobacteria bacterium]|nr:ChbG/HpnK family deacetylase [Deltaproteobacteria bacterium]
MILCADDYGISPAVSTGILELVKEKRLSAVSCMMLGPHVDESMRRINGIGNGIDLGLHLVMTDDRPLTPLQPESGLVDAHGKLVPFSKLSLRAYRRAIDFGCVLREIEEQIRRFETLAGRPPDFIDGHQHVQQLPVIRKALATALRSLIQRHQNIYVRVARLPMRWLWTKGLRHSWKFFVGNHLVSLPGGSTALLMNETGIPSNRFLLGFCDYEKEARFEAVFQRYLTLKPGPRDIFFCHPGYVDEALRRRDSVTGSRINVLEFLRSSRCQTIMEESGVGLNTFYGA